MPETCTSAIHNPIAPDCSCSDKLGMNNKAINLKLLCFFIHVYLQATCEMIKYFASLIWGGGGGGGRPVQNIVSQQYIAGGSQCL